MDEDDSLIIARKPFSAKPVPGNGAPTALQGGLRQQKGLSQKEVSSGPGVAMSTSAPDYLVSNAGLVDKLCDSRAAAAAVCVDGKAKVVGGAKPDSHAAAATGSGAARDRAASQHQGGLGAAKEPGEREKGHPQAPNAAIKKHNSNAAGRMDRAAGDLVPSANPAKSSINGTRKGDAPAAAPPAMNSSNSRSGKVGAAKKASKVLPAAANSKLDSTGELQTVSKASSKGKASDKALGDGEKKEKKVFGLPGQTRDTPPETDSLRKFYSSLLDQRPESEMAKRWCLTHGLLDQEDAEVVLQQLRKCKGTPVKAERGKHSADEVEDDEQGPPKPKRPRTAVKAVVKDKAKGQTDTSGSSRLKPKVCYDEDASDDEQPLAVALAKGARKATNSKTATTVKTASSPAVGKDHVFKDAFDSDSESDQPLATRKQV